MSAKTKKNCLATKQCQPILGSQFTLVGVVGFWWPYLVGVLGIRAVYILHEMEYLVYWMYLVI